jgi:hypothetical protein
MVYSKAMVRMDHTVLIPKKVTHMKLRTHFQEVNMSITNEPLMTYVRDLLDVPQR